MRKSGLFSLNAISVAIIASGLSSGTAMAAGDAAQGAKLYAQCRACHTVNRGGANTLGPNLAGIVGAKAGLKQGFKYSPALVKSNIVWTPQKLDAWLMRPAAVVPGNKMAFAGIANPQARASIIAYLAQQK